MTARLRRGSRSYGVSSSHRKVSRRTLLITRRCKPLWLGTIGLCGKKRSNRSWIKCLWTRCSTTGTTNSISYLRRKTWWNSCSSCKLNMTRQHAALRSTRRDWWRRKSTTREFLRGNQIEYCSKFISEDIHFLTS